MQNKSLTQSMMRLLQRRLEMTLIPILLIGAYVAWQVYRESTRIEAAREFARIDYNARKNPPRRR